MVDANQANAPVLVGTVLGQDNVMLLAGLATGGLVIMWVAFWWSAARRGENISEILASAGFFRTVVVMGVIAATAVLSLAGRLEANTSAILSGVVGYVLGHLSSRQAKA